MLIQASYIADKDTAEKRYPNLWKAITANALTERGELDSFSRFSPSTCDELYAKNTTDSIFNQKAFVINPRALGSFAEDDLGSVLIRATADSNEFAQTTTYPRLVYAKPRGGFVDESELGSDDSEASTFHSALGIYVIAVREEARGIGSDANKHVSQIAGQSGAGSIRFETVPAFYDFYIRTCWYGSDAKLPSTISTVIRLYDPDALDLD